MKVFPKNKDKQQKHSHAHDKSFAVGKFHNIKVKSGSVKFKRLYQLEPWQRYLAAGLVGFCMAIIVQFMIKNTGLYNTGLSAIIQGFSRLVYTIMTHNNISESTATLTFNLMFWIVYFLINIPIFIFAYFKVGKTFAKLTFVYLLVNTSSGFALSSIPGVSEIFILGRTIPDANNILTTNHVFVMPFYFQTDNKLLFDVDHDPIKSFFLFLTASVYGFLSSVSFAILYIIGSCSAGLDIISIFYATKKNKNISGMLVTINSISMVIGATTGSYFSGAIINPECWSWEFFFSANLFASFLSIIIFGMFLNRFFPLNKNVRVEIFSNNIKQIREYLYSHQYTHPLTIYKTIGGYSLQDHEMLVTICMYIELPKLVNHIRDIDQKCLIVATKVDDIDGTINVYQQGSTE